MDPLPAKNIPTTALVVNKPGDPFTLQDIILDEVRPDEVLVEILYTGLCHTVRPSYLPTYLSTDSNPGHRGPIRSNPHRKLPRRARA